jgi:hypothetical protein
MRKPLADGALILRRYTESWAARAERNAPLGSQRARPDRGMTGTVVVNP